MLSKKNLNILYTFMSDSFKKSIIAGKIKMLDGPHMTGYYQGLMTVLVTKRSWGSKLFASLFELNHMILNASHLKISQNIFLTAAYCTHALAYTFSSSRILLHFFILTHLQAYFCTLYHALIYFLSFLHTFSYSHNQDIFYAFSAFSSFFANFSSYLSF